MGRTVFTLAELKKIDIPTPVWVEVEGKTPEGWDGYWSLCQRGYILTPGRNVMDSEYMVGVKFFDSPSSGVNRKPCMKCASKCYFCIFNESSRCEKCKDKGLYQPIFNFCPECGRSLSEESCEESDRQLTGEKTTKTVQDASGECDHDLKGLSYCSDDDYRIYTSQVKSGDVYLNLRYCVKCGAVFAEKVEEKAEDGKKNE